MVRTRAAWQRNTGAVLAGVVALGLASVAGVGVAGVGVAAAATSTVTVTAATPLTVVSSATGSDAAIGDVTLTPAATSTIANDYVCVSLPAGDNFDTASGMPTVSQTNGAATTGVSSAPVVTAASLALGSQAGDTGASATQGNILSFQVAGEASSSIPTFVLANLHVDGVGASAGAVSATVGTATSALGCATASSVTALGSGTVYEVATSNGAIYGQSPAATAAAEFDAALVSGSGASTTCSDHGNAVVATSADPYDALSAAYLESQLGTGVLITAPTSLDSSTLAALKLGGVQRVYVVGGLLAVSQADINALKSTPAYDCGGTTPTGKDITVYSGISGQTADDTAAAIDSYITGSGTGALPSVAGAYSTESTYNQTTGNETTTAPSGTQKTAIVVADRDFQDATAAAGMAYEYKLPVILTPGNALGPQATSELTKLGITQVVALGGQLALQPQVVSSIEALNVGGKPISVLRIAGADGTESAADLALFEGQRLGWHDSTVLVAQGAYWSDALGSAALAGKSSESLLLTEGPKAGVGQYTAAVLKTAGTSPGGLGAGVTTSIQVLGGPLAIPQAQVTQMQQALAAG
ncbi:MAG: cell wall-binding repeat-containing protein [Acidimicrobiales bacterium]